MVAVEGVEAGGMGASSMSVGTMAMDLLHLEGCTGEETCASWTTWCVGGGGPGIGLSSSFSGVGVGALKIRGVSVDHF
jgi:hypothetical protein